MAKGVYWCDRIILWILLVLVFCLPLVYDPRLFDVVSLPKVTLLRLCVLIMAAAWFVKSFINRQSSIVNHQSLTWPVLGFLGICVLGTIFSINRALSFFGIYKFYFWGLGSIVCYVILYFIVISSIKPGDIDKILIVILISSSIVAILGITQHFGLGLTHWGRVPRARVISTLGNPNFLGAYLVMIIPLSLSWLIKMADGRWQMADKEHRRVSSLRFLLSALCSLLSLVLLFVCLLFTYSRGAWVGFAGSLLLLGVIFRRELLKRWKPVVIGAIIVLGLFFWKGSLFLERAVSTVDFQEPDIASRFSAWKSTLQMIKEHPFLGTGLDTYVLKFRQYMSVDYEHLAGKLAMAGFAHNHFLQITSDLGLIGFGFYLWLLLTFFITCFKLLLITDYPEKLRNGAGRLLIIGIMAGVVALLIQDQFSFSPLTTSTYFWLFLGLVTVMERSPEYQSTRVSEHQSTRKIRNPKSEIRNKSKIPNSKFKIVNRQSSFVICLVLVGSVILLWLVSRPYRADLHFSRGMAYKSAGNYANAIDEYKRALALNSYPGIYHMNLAKTYVQMATDHSPLTTHQFLEKAVEEFKKEIKARPLYALGYNGLGVAYLELGKLGDREFYDSSVEVLNRAVELDPNFADAWTNLGVVYEKKKIFDKAIFAYKKALEIDPGRTVSLFNLGCIYGNRGRYKEARECWKKVLAIDPKHEKAKEYLELLKTP